DFVTYTYTKACHYCYAPIYWCRENRMHTRGGSSYYLDRTNSALGYSKENCVVCCTRCNRGKSDLFTYDEWWAMTEVFRRKHEQGINIQSSGSVGEADGQREGGEPHVPAAGEVSEQTRTLNPDQPTLD